MKPVKPLHDWHRHHPTARRIAARLLESPALLALRPRTLIQDIRATFGVAGTTATVALRFAREFTGRLE